jgi:CheY-like chemotaxis protein
MELGRALAAAQRARDLVKQILAFSRQSDEERVPVRVGMVVKEAIRFLRATIPATVEIQTRLSDPNGTVMASAVEIHQIVMNLCTNAVHALGGQPGRLEIEIGAVEIPSSGSGGIPDLEAGPYVRIAVTDTGCGMSPGVAQRIFDPYFTTKEKGVGTGLGLAVVHGIVTKHGGAVRFETEAGKGSTFHVFLPKVDLARPLKTEAPEPIAGGSGRILFVDDEKMLVEIADQALRRLGFEVETRTSPIEALELFRAKPRHFDLVITDQAMPGMTGEALAAEITRLRPEIPVILCTGYSQALSKQQFQKRGIRSLVMKPMLINELAAAIREVLPT